MERRRRGMARAGDVLENPMSGQRIIFRKTAEDTGGELLEVESIYTKPSPSRPPAHYHPYQEELFEVLSGRLRVVVEGEERAYGEGESFVVPPGVPHEMWTEEAGTRMSWQTRPAMKTEEFFETVWGLAEDGKTNEKGVPNLLQVAVIAHERADEYRLVKPPWPVQRALFAVLAPIGRLLGYRASYPEYGG
jgi:quercetin dioxygenase-like cupin family protein